jgi:hypothetical protein
VHEVVLNTQPPVISPCIFAAYNHCTRYEATSYDVEVSYGPRNDSFSRLVVVSGAAPRLASVAHLPPEVIANSCLVVVWELEKE